MRKSGLLALAVLSLLPGVSHATPPLFKNTFGAGQDAEVWQLGDSVDAHNVPGTLPKWQVRFGKAKIMDATALAPSPGSGGGVLQLVGGSHPSVEVSRFMAELPSALSAPVTYLDFYTLPVAELAREALSSVHVNGALLAFVQESASVPQTEGPPLIVPTGYAKLLVGDFEPAPPDPLAPLGAPPVLVWKDTQFRFALKPGSLQAREWMRITVRQDAVDTANPRWDLYVNGSMFACNLRPEPANQLLKQSIFFGSESASDVLLDDLSLGVDNPLGSDTDNDGMTDAMETGLSPGGNVDRNTVASGQTLSWVERLVANTRAAFTATWSGSAPGSPPTHDEDGDGIPDYWETAFGMNPNNPSDAPLDFDGDGKSNLQEFLNSSNPKSLPLYRFEPLDTAPGAFYSTLQVARTYFTAAGQAEKVLAGVNVKYRDGSTGVQIVTLTGTNLPAVQTLDLPADCYDPVLLDINRLGDACGSLKRREAGGMVREYGFLYRSGVMYVCAHPTLVNTWAYGISDGGKVFSQTNSTSWVISTALFSVSGGNLQMVQFTPPSGYVGVTPAGTTTDGWAVGHAYENGTWINRIFAIAPNSTATSWLTSLPVSGPPTLTGSIPGRFAIAGTSSGVPYAGAVSLQTSGAPGLTTYRPSASGTSTMSLTAMTRDKTSGQDWVAVRETLASSAVRSFLARTVREAPGDTYSGEMAHLERGLPPLGTYAAPADSAEPVHLPLGDLGGNFVEVEAMNSKAIATGMARNAEGVMVPFISRFGRISELPKRATLPAGYRIIGTKFVADSGNLLVNGYLRGRYFPALLRPVADTDGDGISDEYEQQYGLNAGNAMDADLDPDGDGLTNRQEFLAATSPSSPDTDGDGIPDGWEVAHYLNPLDGADASRDYDGDRLTNLQEYRNDSSPFTPLKIEGVAGGGLVGESVQVTALNDAGAATGSMMNYSVSSSPVMWRLLPNQQTWGTLYPNFYPQALTNSNEVLGLSLDPVIYSWKWLSLPGLSSTAAPLFPDMTGLSYPYMANRQGDILSYYYTGNYVSHFDICTRADGLRRPVPVPPLGPVYMYTGLSSRDVVKAPADTSPLIVAGTYNHQAGDTYVQEGFLWRDTGGSGTYEYITSAESRDVHVMHSTSGGSALCRGFAQNTGVNYFEWSGGVSKPVELNDPAAAFTARNNRGDAIFSGGLEGPVLYTRGVAMPVSRLMTGQNGFVLRNASAINDLGQILCVGPVNNDPGSLDTLKLVKFADDENGDGFPDDWVKYYFGSYQYLYATTDSDGDGLTNREEFELGTDPTSADTDADGYTDSYEKTHGMNALVADVVRPGGMPFINEIVARNEGSHLTEGGLKTDWIELCNPGNQYVDLKGWRLWLANNPQKSVTFPPGLPLLAPGEYFMLHADSGAPGGLVSDSVGLYQDGNDYFVKFNIPDDGTRVCLTPPPPEQVPPQPLPPLDIRDAIQTVSFETLDADESWAFNPSGGRWQVSTKPTFKAPNSSFVESPQLKLYINNFRYLNADPSGYYDAPFNISFGIEGFLRFHYVLYTLDGTEPSVTNPASRLARPEQLIRIEANTILRARAWRDSLFSQEVGRTYLLLPDVFQQRRPEGSRHGIPGDPKFHWSYPFDTTAASAYMTPAVPAWVPPPQGGQTENIATELKKFPIVSLIAAPEDLFQGDKGIYANSMESGAAWEKSGQFMFSDLGTNPWVDSSAPCLIEMHGETSRLKETTPKHSFRVKFRRRAGASNITGQFFQASGGNAKYDSLVLKSPSADDWAGLNAHYADSAAYLREAWVAACHRLLGVDIVAPRHRWVSLYINGFYWGLYDLQEEADGDFMRRLHDSRGVKDTQNNPPASADFDIVKDGSLKQGTTTAWNALTLKAWQMRNAVILGTTASLTQADTLYGEITQQLDAGQFIDYILLNLYLHNEDWPDHNWIAFRMNSAGFTDDLRKFRFVSHDAEIVARPERITADPFKGFFSSTETGDAGASGTDIQARGIAALFHNLSAHANFRTLLTARLTALQAKAHPASGTAPFLTELNAAADRVLPSLLPESARWGRQGTILRGPGKWLTDVEAIRTFLAGRWTGFAALVGNYQNLAWRAPIADLGQGGVGAWYTAHSSPSPLPAVTATSQPGPLPSGTEGGEPTLPGGHLESHTITYNIKAKCPGNEVVISYWNGSAWVSQSSGVFDNLEVNGTTAFWEDNKGRVIFSSPEKHFDPAGNTAMSGVVKINFPYRGVVPDPGRITVTLTQTSANQPAYFPLTGLEVLMDQDGHDSTWGYTYYLYPWNLQTVRSPGDGEKEYADASGPLVIKGITPTNESTYSQIMGFGRGSSGVFVRGTRLLNGINVVNTGEVVPEFTFTLTGGVSGRVTTARAFVYAYLSPADPGDIWSFSGFSGGAAQGAGEAQWLPWGSGYLRPDSGTAPIKFAKLFNGLTNSSSAGGKFGTAWPQGFLIESNSVGAAEIYHDWKYPSPQISGAPAVYLEHDAPISVAGERDERPPGTVSPLPADWPDLSSGPGKFELASQLFVKKPAGGNRIPMAEDKVTLTETTGIQDRPASFGWSDRSGARFRRILPGGAPAAAAKGQQNAESDEYSASTLVDSLTLQLQHQTGDIYIPLAGSDLTLSVKRGLEPALWSDAGGPTPENEFPGEKPFGQCWSSGVAPYLMVDEGTNPAPAGAGGGASWTADKVRQDAIIICDEDGTRHRFYKLLTTVVKNAAGEDETVFLPELTSQSTPEAYANRLLLRHTPDGAASWFEFRRKFGNTLRFPVTLNHQTAMAGTPKLINSDRQGKTKRQRTVYRAQEAADRFGGVVTYCFTSAGDSLIPDRIIEGRRLPGTSYAPAFLSSEGPGRLREITLTQSEGHVLTAMDPMGNVWRYTYSTPGSGTGVPPQAGKLLEKVESPEGHLTSYLYNGATRGDKRTPPNGDAAATYTHVNPWRISTQDRAGAHPNAGASVVPATLSTEVGWQWDQTTAAWDPATNAYYDPSASRPRLVASITLPGRSPTYFSPVVNLPSPAAARVPQMGVGTNGEPPPVRVGYAEGLPVVVGSRITRVTDGLGNLWYYTYDQPKVADGRDLAEIVTGTTSAGSSFNPVIYWTRCKLTYPAVGAAPAGNETVVFDPAAGLADQTVTDYSGNVTEFEHADAFEPDDAQPELRPVALLLRGLRAAPLGAGTVYSLPLYHSEPTAEKRWLSWQGSAPVEIKKTFSYYSSNQPYPGALGSTTWSNGSTISYPATREERAQSPAARVMVCTIDPLGTATVTEIDPATGLGRRAGVLQGSVSSTPLDETYTERTHPIFKSFITRQTHYKVIPAYDSTGAHLENGTDQVTTFEPDRYGYNASATAKATVVTDAATLTTGDSFVTSYSRHDANGRITEAIDPLLRVTRYTYDGQNRLTSTRFPDGSVKRAEYEATGRTVWEADESWQQDGEPGQVTIHVYGNDGCLQKVVQDMNGNGYSPTDTADLVTQTWRDAIGRVTAVKDPRGTVRRSTYDAMGRKVHDFTAYTGMDLTGPLDAATAPCAGRVEYRYGTGAGGGAFASSGFTPTTIVEYRGVPDFTGALTFKRYRTDSFCDTLYRARRVVKAVKDTDPTVALPGRLAPEDWLVTTTEYDNAGRVTKVTAPNGQVISTEYDGMGRPVVEKHSFDITYNGTEIENTSPTARFQVVRHFYSSTLEWRTETYVTDVPLSFTSATPASFLAANLVNVSETKFDPSGRALAVWTTQTTPSGSGSVALVKTAPADDYSGSPVTYAYFDAAGQTIASRDPLGRVSRVEYDVRGRKTREILPAAPDADVLTGVSATAAASTLPQVPAETLTAYYKNGLVKSATAVHAIPGTGGSGIPWLVSLTEYDAAGRAVKSVSGPSNVSFTLQSVATVDASGGPIISVTASRYDKNGNVVAVQDANGNVTLNEYSALNKLAVSWTHPSAALTFPAPGVIPATPAADAYLIGTRNFYDSAGNLVGVIDGEGRKTGYVFDGAGRNVITQWDPDAPVGVRRQASTLYQGNLARSTVKADGSTINYLFDRAARPTRTLCPLSKDNSTTTYNLKGRVASVTYPDDTQFSLLRGNTFLYDEAGRLIQEVSAGVPVRYKYDRSGAVRRVDYGLPSSPPDPSLTWTTAQTRRSIASTYDSRGRLELMEETGVNPETGVSGTRVTRYYHRQDGGIARMTQPNGQWTDHTIDVRGRPLDLVTKTASGILSATSTKYDPAGNVTRMDESGPGGILRRTVTNTYDRVYRLTQELSTSTAYGNTDSLFQYDRANNRTVSSVTTAAGTRHRYYSYATLSSGNANQLMGWTAYGLESGGASYYYDENGNRSGESVMVYNSGGGWESRSCYYAWNTFDQMVGVMLSSYSDTAQKYLSHSYAYDARSRRVMRNETTMLDDDITSRLDAVVFSGGLGVQELGISYTGTGAMQVAATPSAEFVRGSDQGGGIGGILYTLRPAEGSVPPAVRYPAYNQRGDTVTRMDSAGNFAWSVSYDAFGKRIEATESGTTRDRQNANTKDEDPTGLINDGLRYRDAENGVFLSRDPAGMVDGPNGYTYVRQNPWTLFDPHGLDSHGGLIDSIWNAGVGALQFATDVTNIANPSMGSNFVLTRDSDGSYSYESRQWQSTKRLWHTAEHTSKLATVLNPGGMMNPEAQQVVYQTFTHLTGGEGQDESYRLSYTLGTLLTFWIPGVVEGALPSTAYRLSSFSKAPALAGEGTLFKVFEEASAPMASWSRTGETFTINSKGTVFFHGKDLFLAEARPFNPTVSTSPAPHLSPTATPQRIQGPWTLRDVVRAQNGQGPLDFVPTMNRAGKEVPLELHHADQMPGSAVHEVPPFHSNIPGAHPNKFNQGVTPTMRTEDAQLHWYLRIKEMGY